MGEHIIDGEFQSDKYPDTPRGLVPFKCTDVMAQDLLWEYAQRRREIDPEFADDLEEALKLKGFILEEHEHCWHLNHNYGVCCNVQCRLIWQKHEGFSHEETPPSNR